VLRDDGINYSDYVTELVLLLIIKMVHENTESAVLGRIRVERVAEANEENKKKDGKNLLVIKTMVIQ